MKILAVDTALGACSVAVLENDRALAHRFVRMERGHAEALAPMVRDVMDEAGLVFSTLDRLAVTTGPGTFTGQRVGLAFMRGLRLALQKPLVGVTTLDAMAAAVLAASGAPAAAVLHDAKRGEVYLEATTKDGPLLPAQIQGIDAAAVLLADALAPSHRLALGGTAAAEAANRLRGHGLETVLTPITAPDALWVARLGRRAAEPVSPPSPFYLRAPDAKLPARAGAV